MNGSLPTGDAVPAEKFWEQFLDFVGSGKVLPIVAPDLATVRPPDGVVVPINTWLASALASDLDVALPAGWETPTLNQVVSLYLQHPGELDPYTRVKQLLGKAPPSASPALVDLAAIRHFNLFLYTGFDPLLVRALDEVRHQGQPLTATLEFFPEKGENANPGLKQTDLPARKPALPTTVYHVLGRVSNQPRYVLWDEDLMEFVLSLHQQLPLLQNLAWELQDQHLLMLGSRFSDWVTRFFLRVARQRKLSDASIARQYLADGPAPLDENLVLFFNAVSKKAHVVQCSPTRFVSELRRQWETKLGPSTVAAETPAADCPPARMPDGAIFVSYARRDLAMVQQLCRGLREAGLDVWFDLERLKAGDDWLSTLEQEVSERAGLFLSVISRTTEQRAGYYHTEREWAANRALKEGSFAAEFYLPVVVDDLPYGQIERENRIVKTHKFQLNRLLGGNVTPDFVGQLRGIIERRRERSAASGPTAAPARPPS